MFMSRSCKNYLGQGKNNVCHGITMPRGYGYSKLQLTLNSEQEIQEEFCYNAVENTLRNQVKIVLLRHF